MSEFKLGDTVQIIRSNNELLNVKNGELNYGDIGVVCHLLNFSYCIGVKFDRKIMYGHDCQGTCENRKGFYYTPKNLLLIHDKVLTVKEWKYKNKIATDEES